MNLPEIVKELEAMRQRLHTASMRKPPSEGFRRRAALVCYHALMSNPRLVAASRKALADLAVTAADDLIAALEKGGPCDERI